MGILWAHTGAIGCIELKPLQWLMEVKGFSPNQATHANCYCIVLSQVSTHWDLELIYQNMHCSSLPSHTRCRYRVCIHTYIVHVILTVFESNIPVHVRDGMYQGRNQGGFVGCGRTPLEPRTHLS